MRRHLVIFGREPLPGRVKRRLADDIGFERAAEIYALLLAHALAVARDSGLPWTLSLAERPSADWAGRLERTRWEVQAGRDLGQRLWQTFASHIQGGADQVVIVGSDCPAVTVRHLRRSFRRLEAHRAVVGPARDGGYWLIGQQGPAADLFSGIPWSSPRTLDATRQRLGALKLSWAELETLADVDTAADLASAIADASLPVVLRRKLERVLQGEARTRGLSRPSSRRP
jgi:hypothetical protein